MASDRFCRPPVPLTDEDIAYQRKAVAAHLPPRPNWKWPISHADRIKELMVAKQEPHNAPHRENIEAAIQYHMAFSEQEQLCSSELVWFQGGRQVDAPYQHGDQRPAWSEVRGWRSLVLAALLRTINSYDQGVFKQMMNSAGGSASSSYPLGPPANPTSNATFMSCGFDPQANFHQVNTPYIYIHT